MGTKPHKHRKHKNETHQHDQFTNFIEKNLEKNLIELVNAKSWPRRYIVLGKIKTLSDIIDEAQKTSNKKYKQLISVTFRRLR